MPAFFSDMNLFTQPTPVDNSATVATPSERKPFISDESKQSLKNFFSFKKDNGSVATPVSTTEVPTAEPTKTMKDRVTSFFSSKKETAATDSSAVVSTTHVENKPSYYEKTKAIALRTFTSTPEEKAAKAIKAQEDAKAKSLETRRTNIVTVLNNEIALQKKEDQVGISKAFDEIAAFMIDEALTLKGCRIPQEKISQLTSWKNNPKDAFEAIAKEHIEATTLFKNLSKKFENNDLTFEAMNIRISESIQSKLPKSIEKANEAQKNQETVSEKIEENQKALAAAKAAKKTARADEKALKALQAYTIALTKGIEALTEKVNNGSLEVNHLDYTSNIIAKVHNKNVDVVKAALIQGLAPSIRTLLSDQALIDESEKFTKAGTDVLTTLSTHRDAFNDYTTVVKSDENKLGYVNLLDIPHANEDQAFKVYKNAVTAFTNLVGINENDFPSGKPSEIQKAIVTATKAANQKKKEEHNLVRENLIKNANLSTYSIFDEAIADFNASKAPKLRSFTDMLNDMLNAFGGVKDEANEAKADEVGVEAIKTPKSRTFTDTLNAFGGVEDEASEAKAAEVEEEASEEKGYWYDANRSWSEWASNTKKK